MKQVLSILVIALLCATIFIFWSQRWNNPSSQDLNLKGEFIYHERPIEVEIKCACPEALIESRRTHVAFNIRLKWEYGPADKEPFELIYAYAEAAGATVEPPGMIAVADVSQLGRDGVVQSMPLTITPTNAGVSQITFHFAHYVKPEPDAVPLGAISAPIDFRPSFASSVAPYTYCCLVFVFAVGVVVWLDTRQRRLKDQTRKQVEQAKDQWEKAQIKLEAYFDANLFQVGLVFWVAVTVMAIGFCFVLWGVLVSVRQPATLTSASGVSVLSGIITEFIGATFMVIYRSTVAQANEFVSVLERLNRVGIAMQVLNSISESGSKVQDEARARVASSLVDTGLTVAGPMGVPASDDSKGTK